MATLVFHTAVDMETISLSWATSAYEGAVTTPTMFTLLGQSALIAFSGYGFTYDILGGVEYGIVTRIERSNFSQTLYTLSDVSLGAHSISGLTRWGSDPLETYRFEEADEITGSTGSDRVFGRWGNDTISGDFGSDSLDGGYGDDTVYGGPGNDVIVDASGSNLLWGDEGNDTITGGDGFDNINGNVGDDSIRAGFGDDWVSGGKNVDVLYGDDGDDVVYGNMGTDTCWGGAGADIVRGGQDNDVISGEAGNDWMSGDRGDDTISGGAGADIFHTSGDAGLDWVTDFSRAEGDRVMVDPGTQYTLSQIGADAVITMVAGARMVLVGVQVSSLTGDWIFGA